MNKLNRIKGALLELHILVALWIVCTANAVEKWATQRFYSLIHRRSPEQIKRMERRNGLV